MWRPARTAMLARASAARRLAPRFPRGGGILRTQSAAPLGIHRHSKTLHRKPRDRARVPSHLATARRTCGPCPRPRAQSRLACHSQRSHGRFPHASATASSAGATAGGVCTRDPTDMNCCAVQRPRGPRTRNPCCPLLQRCSLPTPWPALGTPQRHANARLDHYTDYGCSLGLRSCVVETVRTQLAPEAQRRSVGTGSITPVVCPRGRQGCSRADRR